MAQDTKAYEARQSLVRCLTWEFVQQLVSYFVIETVSHRLWSVFTQPLRSVIRESFHPDESAPSAKNGLTRYRNGRLIAFAHCARAWQEHL